MANSKFFTNEPERDLYTRFTKILKHNTQLFDILVGYFRSSGFFRMQDALEDVEKIRVLVGLNVDKYTVNIIDSANEELEYERKTEKEGKLLISDEIADEFVKVEETENVEKGVRTFIDWLKSGKMEMRMFVEEPLHAKVYIMREPEESPNMGCVITGSSNFSEAGLKGNREFNVELRDDDDVEFALNQFEELWKLGVPINETYIDTVQQKTWMKNDITPYEIFLKTLYEFFKEEINADSEASKGIDPPEGFMLLQYQKDAVTQAKKMLDAYNGVFISDVVGLGKTFITAMLLQTLKGKKLVICPPVLQDYWSDVLYEFGIQQFKVESLGKLQSVMDKGFDEYKYIVVDEAHRFRNNDTEAYKMLHEICYGKKVILISATPINNYTSDIANQIYLFQSPKASNICPGLKNLELYFGKLQGLVKKQETHEGRIAQLRKNSEDIRDKILRRVMIRRTRGEIMEYYKDDLENQGLSFPKLGTPIPLEYKFDAQLNKIFNDTMAEIKEFKYSRYMPLLYLKDSSKYASEIAGQRNMGGFMKGILVKRLESSFYAFNKSLDRFISSYKHFINMYEKGTIYISKKVNVYELLDNGDDEKLMKLAEEPDDKVRKFKSDEFTDSFIQDLREDYEQLLMLKAEWKTVVEDPKLKAFIEALKTDKRMKDQKVIIFTESKETADYLEKHIVNKVSDRAVRFSGGSSKLLKAEIEYSFNPKYDDAERDQYDILITTDVLAEGVNLHKAGVLINYDLPWNPTKMMQRVGRINRVGSPHDEIFVFNFFPTEESSEQIPLKDRILEKLQAFHDTLGNDIAYLCDEEDVSSQKLFERMSNIDDDEEGTNPELKYLGIIRQIRDNDTDLYEKIKNMPLKAKVGRKSSLNGTVSMIKQGAYKTFFLTSDGETEQLPFLDAMYYMEADKNEEGLEVSSKYYKELDANRNAFDDVLIEEDIADTDRTTKGTKGNDTKIINFLQAAKQSRKLTDEEESKADLLIGIVRTGEVPDKIEKNILKDIKSAKDAVEMFHIINDSIPETYYAERQPNRIKIDGEKQVIVSECLVK